VAADLFVSPAAQSLALLFSSNIVQKPGCIPSNWAERQIEKQKLKHSIRQPPYCQATCCV